MDSEPFSAQTGLDFVAETGMLYFSGHENQKIITVQTTGDLLREDSEFFNIYLEDLVPVFDEEEKISVEANIIGQNPHQVLITDDDPITQTPTPTQTPTITPTNTITNTITRTQTPSNTITPTNTFTPTPTNTITNTQTRTPVHETYIRFQYENTFLVEGKTTNIKVYRDSLSFTDEGTLTINYRAYESYNSATLDDYIIGQNNTGTLTFHQGQEYSEIEIKTLPIPDGKHTSERDEFFWIELTESQSQNTHVKILGRNPYPVFIIEPTPSPTYTPTQTETPTQTPSNTQTPSSTITQTDTPTVTPTISFTQTRTSPIESSPSHTPVYNSKHFAGLYNRERFLNQDLELYTDIDRYTEMIMFLGKADHTTINRSSAFYLKGNSLYAAGKKILTQEPLEDYDFNKKIGYVEKILDNVEIFDSTSYSVQEDGEDVEYENLYFVNSEDGKLYAFGGNHYGQIGLGHNELNHNDPLLVKDKDGNDILNVIKISTYGGAAYFIKENGELWGVGNNSHGQLGLGDPSMLNTSIPWDDTDDRYRAEKIADNVVEVFAGHQRVMFIKDDESLWAAGNNEYYQLGIEQQYYEFNPDNDPVDAISVPVKVATGVRSVELMKDASLYVSHFNAVYICGVLSYNHQRGQYDFIQLDSTPYLCVNCNYPWSHFENAGTRLGSTTVTGGHSINGRYYNMFVDNPTSENSGEISFLRQGLSADQVTLTHDFGSTLYGVTKVSLDHFFTFYHYGVSSRINQSDNNYVDVFFQYKSDSGVWKQLYNYRHFIFNIDEGFYYYYDPTITFSILNNLTPDEKRKIDMYVGDTPVDIRQIRIILRRVRSGFNWDWGFSPNSHKGLTIKSIKFHRGEQQIHNPVFGKVESIRASKDSETNKRFFFFNQDTKDNFSLEGMRYFGWNGVRDVGNNGHTNGYNSVNTIAIRALDNADTNPCRLDKIYLWTK